MATEFKLLEKENAQLLASVQSLNMRLRAATEIINIQEAEMLRLTTAGQKLETPSILTRWREKVFALLVQAKSAELVHDREVHELKAAIKELENEKKSAMDKCMVLEDCLQENESRLGEETLTCKVLQDKCDTLGADIAVLQNTQDAHCCQMRACRSLVTAFQENCDRQLFLPLEEALRKLDALEGRLIFATGRVTFLQNHLLRQKVRPSAPHLPTKLTANKIPLAVLEVKQPMPFKSSAKAPLSSSVLSKPEDFLKIRSSPFQHCSPDSQERSIADSSVVSDSESVNSAPLIPEVSGAGVQADTTHSQCLLSAEEQLSSVQQEHARSLVELKRLQRQLEREKEHSAQSADLARAELSARGDQLEAELRTVSRDNSILVAALRQEALVQGIKSSRAKPLSAPTSFGGPNVLLEMTLAPLVTCSTVPDHPGQLASSAPQEDSPLSASPPDDRANNQKDDDANDSPALEDDQEILEELRQLSKEIEDSPAPTAIPWDPNL